MGGGGEKVDSRFSKEALFLLEDIIDEQILAIHGDHGLEAIGSLTQPVYAGDFQELAAVVDRPEGGGGVVGGGRIGWSPGVLADKDGVYDGMGGEGKPVERLEFAHGDEEEEEEGGDVRVLFVNLTETPWAECQI